jgi:hypothetical protein
MMLLLAWLIYMSAAIWTANLHSANLFMGMDNRVSYWVCRLATAADQAALTCYADYSSYSSSCPSCPSCNGFASWYVVQCVPACCMHSLVKHCNRLLGYCWVPLQVKIGDFDFTRRLAENEASMPAKHITHPRYMAPEVRRACSA